MALDKSSQKHIELRDLAYFVFGSHITFPCICAYFCFFVTWISNWKKQLLRTNWMRNSTKKINDNTPYHLIFFFFISLNKCATSSLIFKWLAEVTLRCVLCSNQLRFAFWNPIRSGVLSTNRFRKSSLFHCFWTNYHKSRI